MNKIFLLLTVTFLFSCNQNEKTNIQNAKSEIVAAINDTLISMKQLDKTIQQELYDELDRIYNIRKVALSYLINDKVIDIEAHNSGLQSETLLNNYYKKNKSAQKLALFVKKNNLEKGIIDLKKSLRIVDINCPEGKVLLENEYKLYLKKKLIDSLKSKYNIKNYLAPPKSPKFSLENTLLHYRGNLQSNINIAIISDFECDVCRESYPIYQKLYEKYRNNVKFASSYYSSYVSLSGIACECAGKQNKYWQMYDSIYSLKNIPDENKIYDIAKKINLNMENFKKDFQDKSIIRAIENNFDLVQSKGIYATPTIIINNKAILNSKSFDEIEKLLLKEMKNN